MKLPTQVLLCLIVLLSSFGTAAVASKPAPSWELNDLTGETHRLDDWRGQWVLLKLGTTTCPNCNLELEELGKIRSELETLGVAVLDIYLREDRYTVKKYWKKKAEEVYRPTILYDHRGYLIRDYKVSVIPHLALVDPDGQIVWEGWFKKAPELLTLLEEHISPAAASE